jgi:hypothetical protein
VGGHGDAAAHQSATPRHFMPGAAQRDRWDRLFGPVGEIRINRPREPLPKAFRLWCCVSNCAKFMGRNDAHDEATCYFIPSDAAANVRLRAYEFEMADSSAS